MAFNPDAYLKAQEQGPSPTSGGFDPDAYLNKVAPPAARGEKVYDQPVGPEQASAMDRVVERVKDPARWQAILTGKGPQAPQVVQGDVPLVVPAGAMGRVGQALVKLGEGEGLGYAAGRTALSAGQGAAMSALDSKEGESWQDKIDRAKAGAKLSGGIQLAAESLPYVGKAVGAGFRKLGSALSGEDEAIIGNYAKRTDIINKDIKASGGDVTTAADNIRGELSKGIQGKRSALNGQISAALEKAPTEANISAQPVIDALESQKAKLNPNFNKSAITDIEEMISNVKAQAKDGMLDPRGLYETKQYLGKEAKGSFLKNGQMFNRSGEAARAAKAANAEARAAVKTYIPEIAQADADLSRMHAVEGRLNKNLLAAGTPDGALLAAGTGSNVRNAANLRTLEEISGVPVTQRAKDLATVKAFGKPSWLPKDFTGKAVARIALGAGVGSYVDGKEGALVGGLMASPAAMKGIINASNAVRVATQGAPNVAQFIRQNPIAAQTAVQLASGQMRRANEPTPAIPEASPQLGAQPKGEDRWAARGLDKLGIKDDALTSRLLQDKQARRLLIEASDLKPGSPGMKRIQDQIESITKGLSNDSLSGTPPKVLRQQREPARRR